MRLCREVGNAPAFPSLTRREAHLGPLDVELEAFVTMPPCRSGIIPARPRWRDDMSVVDGNLRVYGIDRLRIAVGSIMPNVTTGNRMAPCVIIGERAPEIIRKDRAI